MFPEPFTQLKISLMPPSQFAQKKVSVMPRGADVMHNDRATYFARVVDDYVAEPHQTLRNTG